MVFGTVPVADWIVSKGSERLRSFKSSEVGRRTFCGDCGTPLYVHVEHQADTIDLSLATLDDPDAHPPTFHIFMDSNIAWFDTADDLPRHAKLRSDTRGLKPGQTELDQSARLRASP